MTARCPQSDCSGVLALYEVGDIRCETCGMEAGGLTWETLADIEMRSIVFLDRPLWQASAFHLVAGRKGVGKGTMIADLAARFTRGELGVRQNVIWIGSEDSASIDIKPRVVAAGGDTERVYVVSDWIQLPRDVDALATTVGVIGDVGLVIIDPVGNHISGRSSNAETDIRDAIGQLNRLADGHECLVIGVRHLSEKEAKAGALAAILGSSAWVQVPRAVIGLARDNEDPQVSHVQCLAGNRLPPDTPGRTFRIEGVLVDGLENEVTRVAWIGDSEKSVETLIGQARKEPSKSASARELILDVLEAAPDQTMESDELDARVAREMGLAAKTIQNLRSDLKREGLIKPVPEKDADGVIERWLIVRTGASRPAATSGSGQPHPDLNGGGPGSGSTTPHPDHIPTHTRTGSGLIDSSENEPHPDSVNTGTGSGPGGRGSASPVDEDEIERLAVLAREPRS
jgi:hypothetical protein